MSEKSENGFGSMVKLGLTLAAYAVVSCFFLAIINNLTAPVIKQHENQALQNGLREVFADADHFSDPLAADKYKAAVNGTIKNVYQALGKDGSVLGAVVELEGKTYDHADIIAGFKNDAGLTISGMKFLALSDSPGFGLKASDASYKVKSGSTFYGQFAGKRAADGFTVDKTYDRISGATITSKSVGVLMEQAAATAGEVLGNSAAGAPAAARTTPFTEEEAVAELMPGRKAIMNPDAKTAAGITAPGTLVNNMRIGNSYVFTADDSSKTIEAAAVAVTGASFHGPASVIVFVDAQRIISGIRITALADSPNYGQNALNESFYKQFTGKSVDQSFVPGSDFDALSGATITSACVADLVKVGAEEAAAIMAANGGAKTPAGSQDYKLNNLQPAE